MNDLKDKGYDVQKMPENKKGYDLKAKNPKTGERLFIEVKADSYCWSDKGVGISHSQYEYARNHRAAFYLAVVENALSNPEIHYIKDPAGLITEYRFDCGWRDVAEDIANIESSSGSAMLAHCSGLIAPDT